MLPVSLDCLFLIAPSGFSITFICFVCLRPVSFVHNVTSVSGLSILNCPFGFLYNVYLFCLSSSCVLCTQYCQCLWIVHSWLHLRFSLTFICFVCLRPVSFVHNIASVSGLSILNCPFGFLYNVYLFCLSSSCVLCTQCCQCLWIVHSWLHLRFSLTFICFVCLRPVSFVHNVTSVSGLSILNCTFGFL
jgi:hypothetical protein